MEPLATPPLAPTAPPDARSSPLSAASSPSSVAIDDQADRRARRRLSERKSREKRKTTFEGMRERIEALECAADNLAAALLLEPEGAVPMLSAAPNDGDDEEAASQRMRDHLRRSMVLAKEATQLKAENAELAAMVGEHEASTAVLRQLTRGMPVDDWSLHVERWSALTRAVFEPWSLEACADVVRDSMRQISKFSFEDGTSESTGLSFMGWRDRRRLDLDAATIHFSFTKSYRNMDAERMACGYWDMHMDGQRYARCMLGPNVKCYYEILQRVTPDICIVRCVEQYPTMPIKVHMLFLLFRVRTPEGFLQGLRSIPCPEVQLATTDEDAYWTTNFHWVKWDITARNSIGECTQLTSSVNGSIASSTVDYANRWMGEAILTLVRAESNLLGRNFLGL